MKGLFAAAAVVMAMFAPHADAEVFRMQYEARVLGLLTIGEATYEVRFAGGRYEASAGVATAGVAALFDQTQITSASAGALNERGPSWASYTLDHSYANKSRRIELSRDTAGVHAQINPPFGNMGDVPATPAQQTSSHDPVTALFALGRQVAASGACNGRAFVFDGRQHYRLALGGGTRGTFNGGGYNGPALRCSLRYEPIAGYTDVMEAREAPLAEVWFGMPGGFSPLLQLTVPTPLGAAQLDLRRYEAG